MNIDSVLIKGKNNEKNKINKTTQTTKKKQTLTIMQYNNKLEKEQKHRSFSNIILDDLVCL
jgi:hypothetical protein